MTVLRCPQTQRSGRTLCRGCATSGGRWVREGRSGGSGRGEGIAGCHVGVCRAVQCSLPTAFSLPPRPPLTLAQDFPLLCPLPAFAEGCTLEDRRPPSQLGGVLFDCVEVGIINWAQAVLCSMISYSMILCRALGTLVRGRATAGCSISLFTRLCTPAASADSASVRLPTLQRSLTGRPHGGEWGTLHILDMIAQHDFSLARAALVASVPGPESGVHRGASSAFAVGDLQGRACDCSSGAAARGLQEALHAWRMTTVAGATMHKWGHLALRGILERQGLLATFRGSVLSGCPGPTCLGQCALGIANAVNA